MFSRSTWPATVQTKSLSPALKLFYGAKTMWPRVMDCVIVDWMGKTRKQIKRQLTRLKEFQRKGKLKQNRIHKKTPPEKQKENTDQQLNNDSRGASLCEQTIMAVTKTIVFQTAPCSPSFVLPVRFVLTILRCSFPVCWSRARDVHHLQLAKFSAAERIRWRPITPKWTLHCFKNC